MDRRRLLKGAASVAATGVLLPAAHARATTADTDFPTAEWLPATASNFTPSSRPSSYPVNFVVVHVTQETFGDTIDIFQDSARQVSAHYVVRSADGHVAQCVRERNVGWHAGNWDYNTRSIGIEHEGWVDRPEYFTDVLYERSAALTSSICDRYGIPKDRTHIIGHNEVPGATHSDPGPFWDWGRYIRLVNFT
ncbi:N-acetylmuramoyl-L-alanine amidase [Streptomyces sp. CA-251247]|uniref:N-acetylmuramoyl-L-alanine amidase n=1 Tax=Streptomyces sp. CA-251247 TaxID=3240062 RepID=UPI003D89BD8C